LILLLITISVIFVFQQWSNYIIYESLSLDGYIVGNEMWLVLYPIPDKFIPYMVISLKYLRKARKVFVEVMLLHIGNTEGYKYWRHILREEASLSIEVVTLASLKGTCSSQVRILSKDL
jgi:hypothetical protein